MFGCETAQARNASAVASESRIAGRYFALAESGQVAPKIETPRVASQVPETTNHVMGASLRLRERSGPR